MSHHPARLSALVDGELDHDARDRVLAHLARCDACRATVEAERRVRSILGEMPVPAPSGDFTANLMQLADPGRPPPPGRWSVHTRTSPGFASAPYRGPLRPPGFGGTRRPGGSPLFGRGAVVGVAGAASLAGMAFVTAFAVGGQPAEPPQVSVVPPVERYSVQHAETVSRLPLTDPGAVTAAFERGIAATSGR